MMILELCPAMQSWENREYKRGLSTHPRGAPMLRVRVLLPTLTTWGWPVRKSRIQLQAEVFSLRFLSLVKRLEGNMVLSANL